VEAETKRMLAAMTRDQKDWWKAEREKVKEAVSTRAYSMPVFKAMSMLRRGKNPDGTPTRMSPFKISKDSLLAAVQGDKTFLKALTRTYSVKGGVDVDVVAELYGFSDGSEMVRQLATAPDMNAWIAAQTDAEMKRLYPDPLVDGTLADNAIRAVHNNKRAEILAAEMRRLRSLMRRDQKIVSATKKEISRSERQARDANRGNLPVRAEVKEIKAAAELSISKIRLVR
jgi:hypothetical protein